jgi:glycosyltransferase involved in cell wall biosynthesis
MERVLANKANYLANLGHKVFIITSDQQGRNPFFALQTTIRSEDLDINYTDNNGKNLINKLLYYPGKIRRHKKRLTGVLMRLKADIVISMFCNDVSFITKIPDGSKKVLEIHFSKFKRLQYGRKGLWRLADRIRNKMDERIVRKFDRFVVLTHEDKSYWGDLPNMEVIANAKNEWGHHTALLATKQVIAVGRFTYQKGYDRLIEAWRLVHERFPEWKLNIIGDGELRNDMQRQIDSYRLEEVIELKMSASDILSEYIDASLLVLSSHYEGLPMVLLEAMSVGLPIVAFECKCGPKDLITNGVEGFLVSEGDVEGLAKQMMCLMADAQLRRNMGQAAQAKSEQYSEPVIMAKWLKLFDNLLEAKA